MQAPATEEEVTPLSYQRTTDRLDDSSEPMARPSGHLSHVSKEDIS